jgi:hypothetical protein
LKRGYISEPDLSLFKITTSVDEAVEEITGFYRNYHSMRYVGERLVLRLQQPLPETALEQLRHDFQDILASGTFEQTGPLPAEANESHLAHLTRLRFRFDRKSLGRLRELIDFVNRAV